MHEVYDGNANYDLTTLQKVLISVVAIILIGMIFYLVIIPYVLDENRSEIFTNLAKAFYVGSLLLSMLFGCLGALLAFTYARSKTNEAASGNFGLKDQLDRLSKLEEAINAHAIVSITDAKGIITYVNDKFCEISKYSDVELIGKNHNILRSSEHDKAFFAELWNL